MSNFNIKFEDREKWGVYKIESRKTGNIYVGKAENQGIYHRWCTHLRELKLHKHTNPGLRDEFDKYGENNLVFSVVEFTKRDRTFLWMREQYYVFDYDWGRELLNVYSEKDLEVYEIAKICIEQKIPITLKTKWANNTMDIVFYKDDDCGFPTKAAYFYKDYKQAKPTIDKHRDYCKEIQVAYYDFEPGDGWFTRDEIIELLLGK